MSLIEQVLHDRNLIKQQYPDVLLLFRIGDFLEAFNGDAVTIAESLHLTLTKRGEVAMVGFPCHSSESYIKRLTAAGVRVAICEEEE